MDDPVDQLINLRQRLDKALNKRGWSLVSSSLSLGADGILSFSVYKKLENGEVIISEAEVPWDDDFDGIIQSLL